LSKWIFDLFYFGDSDVIATSTFKCDLCDYENHTKKGLSCHIAQKHKEKQQQGVTSPIRSWMEGMMIQFLN
jgi:hypothetical protein